MTRQQARLGMVRREWEWEDRVRGWSAKDGQKWLDRRKASRGRVRTRRKRVSLPVALVVVVGVVLWEVII